MPDQAKQLIEKLKTALPGHYFAAIQNAKSKKEVFSLLPPRYQKLVENTIEELEKEADAQAKAAFDPALKAPVVDVPPSGEVETTPVAPEPVAEAVAPAPVASAPKAPPSKTAKLKS